jgi:hypothetical protein
MMTVIVLLVKNEGMTAVTVQKHRQPALKHSSFVPVFVPVTGTNEKRSP